MRVYVLEVGQYDHHTHGVYATLQAAKAAHSPTYTPTEWTVNEPDYATATYAWLDVPHVRHIVARFDAPHDDCAIITEWEVIGTDS